MPFLSQEKFPVSLSQDAPTRLVVQAFNIKAGKYVKLPGGPVGRHRKFIRIENRDPNTDLYLIAGDEQSLDPSQAPPRVRAAFVSRNGGVIELWTNATLYLANENGSGELLNNVMIIELFYV